MAKCSINQTFGDGSPSYKVTYSPEISFFYVNDGTTAPMFQWWDATLKLKCTKKDGALNADPYAMVTYLLRSESISSQADGKVNPIGKTKIWKTSHSGEADIDFAQHECNAEVYNLTSGSTYTPTLKVSTKFWREKLGIQVGGSHTNDAYGSGGASVPHLVRFFKYGISYGSFTTTENYIRINNLNMYRIPSGTYAGSPGRTYGNRSFNFSVPITSNGDCTLSINFSGVSGSARGDSKSISASISKMSGLATVSGSAYFKNGAYKVSLSAGVFKCNDTISVLSNFLSNTGYIYFYAPGDPVSPPNYNPSYGAVNTTAEQVGTNQTKTVSLRIDSYDSGISRYWLSNYVYDISLYWNDGTLIGTYSVADSNMNNIGDHSTYFSTTVQVRSGMRQKDEYVYWTVSGTTTDTTGVRRSGGWKTSGKVNLFWAYVEPSKIAFNSARISSSSGPKFTNNRAQLYYGGTNLNFVLQATINAWGDRPGTRTYEFSLNHPNPVKYYGRIVTSDTGAKSHTYSYTIPDNWVNSSANFTVYKRLDNTEYLFSGNYKSPALGTNHASGGTISFYEVIGGVSGMIDIKPSILMVTIPLIVNGQGIYDKQSSQKVRYYVEVFDRDTNTVINQYVLGNTIGDITKNVTIDLSSTDFTIPEPHLYELRLKADVTELLGNVHTYTFYTTTRQAFLPPRYVLAESTNMLLPPSSDSSLLIRQKATNTYTFRVNYDLSLASSVLNIEYYLASSPNTKRVKTVNIIPKGYTGGSFNGTYVFPNPSTLDPSDSMYDPEGFALGTKVTAWISSTWNLPGSGSVYSNSSAKVHYDVTPTRYIYFLTRGIENEQWLNTVHSVTPTKTDKKSKKIFVETDIS